ncbi:MAG: 2-oxoacid:acceptor oxidoreductase family protein [Ignavibacteriae bacterium]|jgi:2-oxoglutarate ferredoxin oxidoreductase subunit gamma|nr:2-oxoacid:acceptor oxidoreductase family protein [Ignavibacteriota bacterium]
MTEEIIIAGFGGQGVLSMGQTLGYAAMVEGKNVSWMPSYGPEMRGGTANCITIVSDSTISSPIVSKYDTAIILNQPSMEKFESRVKPGGIIVYESTNIIHASERKDIGIYAIPAADEANKLNNVRVANMVLLGAFLEKKPIVSIEAIIEALKKVLPERYHNLLKVNRTALEKGAELMQNMG